MKPEPTPHNWPQYLTHNMALHIFIWYLIRSVVITMVTSQNSSQIKGYLFPDKVSIHGSLSAMLISRKENAIKTRILQHFKSRSPVTNIASDALISPE